MGVDRWSERLAAGVKAWSDHVASLSADALIEARLVGQDDFEQALGIISEEIFARLCLHDFPPISEHGLPAADA